jgi:1-phosphofructokinase family hexose kinase
MIYTVTLNPAIDRELTVSDIQFDTVLRATSCQVDVGGKGFNVSRMLLSLGAQSCALGFVGGKSGEFLEEGLNALGIQTIFVRVAGETRTNISIVTTDHDRYLKVNEPGPEIPVRRQQEFFTRIQNQVKPGDWWVLAGSLPPGVSDSVYSEMIQILKSGGAHTILDTSGKALKYGCQAGAFLVKPNGYEAEILSGIAIQNPRSAVQAASRIQEMGVSNVIISLGKDGAVLSNDQGNWLAHSPKIEESNPIGAGDSLVGGVVWALNSGHNLKEALCWGVACGAASASQVGTKVGSRSLVENLYNLIEIEAV